MPTAFWPSRQWRGQLALTRRAQAVLANLASPGLARGFRAWADLAAARAAARAVARRAATHWVGGLVLKCFAAWQLLWVGASTVTHTWRRL